MTPLSDETCKKSYFSCLGFTATLILNKAGDSSLVPFLFPLIQRQNKVNVIAGLTQGDNLLLEYFLQLKSFDSV